jgi:hypothetical protein
VNFLDCFYCPVYGGSTEIVLTGYYIPQPGGTALEGGSGYNPSNPYGGNLGMATVWAIEDIGYTKVYIDEEYVGGIGNYWPDGKPDCGDIRALNLTFPDGTYTLTATSSKGYYWEGTVPFIAGTCDDVQLVLTEKKGLNPRAIPLSVK